MTARRKLFSIVATCLLFSIVAAFVGITGGCGDGSQGTPDDATKAKIQELEVKVKEAHAKKRLP